MKSLEKLCNLLFYNLYRWDIVCTSFLEYALSFRWVNLFSPSKRRNYDNKFHISNTRYHQSLIYAGNGFFGICLLFLVFISNIIQIITVRFWGFSAYDNVISIIVLVIITSILDFWICSIIIFNNKKYLSSFSEFELFTRQQKKKYGWGSFLFIILLVCLTFGSFQLIFMV